jgi:hypothetical protein
MIVDITTGILLKTTNRQYHREGLKMGFIKYQKENAKKGVSSKTIGINHKGRFAFYKPVVEKYLKDIHYIELFYDPDTRKVGLLPSTEPTPDAFKIQGKTTKMIVAKKFLNRFHISVEDRRYNFSNENGMLIIQL